jgi:hypothetical protein
MRHIGKRVMLFSVLLYTIFGQKLPTRTIVNGQCTDSVGNLGH